ncbi:MAG: hypothetical protein KatS3mg132_705 [Limisphaera sp.]|nr:MAG: hypothetical protein KatS3mg132_705 [Limisphaera sp.]
MQTLLPVLNRCGGVVSRLQHRVFAVIFVVAALLHSQADGATGIIRSWGRNLEGQSLPPAGLSDVTAVAGGSLHSVALRANGKVVAWGWNLQGETNVPPSLGPVHALVANASYTLALLDNGAVEAWGSGPPTAVPDGLTGVIALAAGYAHAAAVRQDGTIVTWGEAPQPPPSLADVVAVAAGRGHTLALLPNSTVAVWGDNTGDKLVLPPDLNEVIAIAAGDHHNLALRGDGTVVAWGANDHGQSVVPAGLSNVVAIAAGSSHSLALRADGTVVAWGRNDFGQSTPPAGLTNVIAISGGGYHSLAIIGDGRPVITVPPRKRDVVLGSTARLYVKAVGFQPLGYQWFKDGVPLDGQTAAMLVIPEADTNHAGLYTVQVSNSLGMAVSPPAELRVRPLPPWITSEPADVTVSCGDPFELSGAAAGSGSLSYQWFFEGIPLPEATQPILAFPVATPDLAGSYTLVVSSEFGAVTSRVATVRVQVDPPTITGPQSARAKQGQPFLATIRAEHSPLAFAAWGLPPGLTVDPTNGVISGVPTQAGAFSVLLAASNICTSASAILQLQVDPSVPVINAPPTVQGFEDVPLLFAIVASETPTRYDARNLPAGLAVDRNTGIISGTPAQAGEFDVVLLAANEWGEARATVRFSIAPRPLTNLTIANVTYTYTAPYLLDFQFSLYDSDDPAVARPVVVNPANLLVVAKENDRPISTNETAWLLSPGAGVGKLIKAVLVLDFSWSVASLVNGDSNTNGISDAVESMVTAAQDFVSRLPAGSQVGVVEFHREDQDPMVVQDLSADVPAVQAAIAGIWTNHVQGFPAGSRVWDALSAAINMLGSSNADEQHYIVFVSDGRDESSTTTLDDLINAATNANIRIYGVGFGVELDAEPLQALTTATSGRLVQAQTSADLAAQLGQLTQDVAGQYVLRWATLRRGDNAFMPSFEVHYQDLIAYSPTNPVWTNFDDPIIDTNSEPPTTNYPLVTNYIIGWYNPADYAGDVTLGLLRLVPDDRHGNAALALRARYIPRFIRRIQLRYRANWPCEVRLLSDAPGELLHGWSLSETNEADGTRVVLLQSPDPEDPMTSLPYGAFGSLVLFTFRDLDTLSNAFAQIEADNTIYTGPQRWTIENTNEFVRVFPPLPFGTPGPWLEQHGFTGDLAAAETSDPDQDGVPTWQEYRADTDPRDPGSRLVLTFLPAIPWSTFNQVAFPTSTRRTYRVERSTDLQSWEAIGPDLPGTGGVLIVTDPQPPWTLQQAFYRVRVW